MRLQLQNIASSKSGASLHKYRGSLGTIATIVREEGASAPFKVVASQAKRWKQQWKVGVVSCLQSVAFLHPDILQATALASATCIIHSCHTRLVRHGQNPRWNYEQSESTLEPYIHAGHRARHPPPIPLHRPEAGPLPARAGLFLGQALWAPSP